MRKSRLWLVLCVVAAMTARTSFAEDPKTIEEALARIEAVLGKAEPETQIEWRVPTKSEFTNKPKADEPAVLQIFDGSKVISQPFAGPMSVSFDEVWHWKRSVFDVSDSGEKTLTRSQVSHNVTRYSVSMTSGQWLVHGMMLTNGVQTAIGKPAYLGIVKWNDDGFELIGTTAVGNYYGAGGKYILGTSYGSLKYTRKGDKLILGMSHQGYELATAPDGNVTHSPDFTKPIGKIFEVEYTSEPLGTGK